MSVVIFVFVGGIILSWSWNLSSSESNDLPLIFSKKKANIKPYAKWGKISTISGISGIDIL